MKTETILMYLGFFLIGIILFYLLRSSCGCKVVEGSDETQVTAPLAEGVPCPDSGGCKAVGQSGNICMSGWCSESQEHCATCRGHWTGESNSGGSNSGGSNSGGSNTPTPSPVLSSHTGTHNIQNLTPSTPEKIKNDLINNTDKYLNVIYLNNLPSSSEYQGSVIENWWWCEGSETQNNPIKCFEKEFTKLKDYGYNVIILSFYNKIEGCTPFDQPTGGCTDALALWNQCPLQNRVDLVRKLNEWGMCILGSYGGATTPGDGPNHCRFYSKNAIDNFNTELNGIDIDLEDTQMSRGTDLECLKDINKIITDIKKKYINEGKPVPIISGAPQSPYFNVTLTFATNYMEYENIYPNDFDFYNIQFYNQGGLGSINNTYDKLFTPSSDNPPNIQYMIDNGLPSSKIVVGACSYPECYNNDNCDNGDFLTASQLMDFITRFDTNLRGIMYWQLYPTGDAGNKCDIQNMPAFTPPHGMTGYDWISTYYIPSV